MNLYFKYMLCKHKSWLSLGHPGNSGQTEYRLFFAVVMNKKDKGNSGKPLDCKSKRIMLWFYRSFS